MTIPIGNLFYYLPNQYMKHSHTKRLAKNTVYMYVRMLLLMAISFYSSRVVLKELGVNDYGTYNVVGSIVTMFNSLRTMFSSSTQRFLNTEMGCKNYQNLSLVFSSSIYVNIFISILFVVAAECIGEWFLINKINIAADRMVAAQWVLQFSIASAVLSIMTTPFDAEIIAHERLGFYAFVSILEGLLKLLVVLCLPLVCCDKLITYGFLILVVSFVIRIINSWFCKLNFPECKSRMIWNGKYIKKMTVFAGWNFFGNTAYAISQSGINMIMNVFGGPAVNAARGIAYQLSSSLNQIIQNVNVVVTPFFTKTYASGDRVKSFTLLYFSSKIFFFIQYSVVIIMFFYVDVILQLWLGDVPKYTSGFLQIILVHSLIRTLHSPLDTLFKSAGELKWYQLCEGIVLSLPIISAYMLLSSGFEFYSVFWGIVFFEILNFMLILQIAQKKCGLSLLSYLYNIIYKCSLLIPLFVITYYFNQQSPESFSKIAGVTLCLSSSFCVFWILCLNHNERELILNLIKEHN